MKIIGFEYNLNKSKTTLNADGAKEKICLNRGVCWKVQNENETKKYEVHKVYVRVL